MWSLFGNKGSNSKELVVREENPNRKSTEKEHEAFISMASPVCNRFALGIDGDFTRLMFVDNIDGTFLPVTSVTMSKANAKDLAKLINELVKD